MRAVIAEHDGAVVKTIGDAVMAIFVDPGAAFAAAIRLPAAVGKVRTESGPLMLRVGLHCGPCIAMQANDKLDYFGTTVNLAARIQHAANAGEVLMSAACAELPDVAAQLRDSALPAHAESLAFKGFAREVPVVRVRAPDT